MGSENNSKNIEKFNMQDKLIHTILNLNNSTEYYVTNARLNRLIIQKEGSILLTNSKREITTEEVLKTINCESHKKKKTGIIELKYEPSTLSIQCNQIFMAKK